MNAITRGRICKLDVIGVPWQGGLADSILHTLWVYGHEAWVNTLTIEPGWLRAVYQGQQDPSEAAMWKYVTKPVVMMAISAFVKFIACSLCIAHQNRKYINLWFCNLVGYASLLLCLKSCTIPATQLTLVLEKQYLLC